MNIFQIWLRDLGFSSWIHVGTVEAFVRYSDMVEGFRVSDSWIHMGRGLIRRVAESEAAQAIEVRVNARVEEFALLEPNGVEQPLLLQFCHAPPALWRI